MKINDPFISNEKLQLHLKNLKNLVENNEVDKIRNLLEQLIESYETKSKIVDQIFFKLKKNNE